MLLRSFLTTALFLLMSAVAIAQSGLRVPMAPGGPPTVAQGEGEFRATLERIFECLAPGLPKDWWRAWVELELRGESASSERNFEGRFYYLTERERIVPRELRSCDAREVGTLTYSLNQFLEPDKRFWIAAKLEFNRDGSFELKYDYGQ